MHMEAQFICALRTDKYEDSAQNEDMPAGSGA